jgi:hypothetical protein
MDLGLGFGVCTASATAADVANRDSSVRDRSVANRVMVPRRDLGFTA